MAVAKYSGTPGTISSGCVVYGTILRCDAGRRLQPAPVASATDAPMSARNRRRLGSSENSAAPSGNSSSAAACAAGDGASSSSPRHMVGAAVGSFAVVSVLSSFIATSR